MNSVIDFHSHILPGVDDGSSGVAESIAMLQSEARQGIRHVVATPHFYPQHDTPEAFLRRREAAEALLRKEMQKYSDLPTLSVGAEVYYFPGMSHTEALQGLTIFHKRCILIEMGTSPWTDEMYRELDLLHRKQGLIPVIAHLDRYIGRFRDFGIPERLEKLPVLVQVNAEFFLNRATASMALRMLKKGRIHLLGSDCHNLSSRKPNLGDAIEVIRKRLGNGLLEVIQGWQNQLLQEETKREGFAALHE